MSSPPPAKPPIRVGQSWLTRDNRLAVIESTTNKADPTYPIRARVHNAAGRDSVSYTPDGRCLIHQEYSLDLITLVSDVSNDASEAAKPNASEAAKPELRVGQTWRDRTGATHTIIYDDSTQYHPLLCDNQCWYGRDGRSIIHDTSPEMELIELVHDTDRPAEPATTDANKPPAAYVIAISHGPDVVSRVMSDGSAWYAPTHHGIPTGPWTRYAD